MRRLALWRRRDWHGPYVVVESGGNQTLAVAGQTHEECVATRAGVAVSPRRSAVGGFLDDAVAGNVNRAVDGGRCPKGCLDLGVAERPHIAVRAAIDGGISPPPDPAREASG